MDDAAWPWTHRPDEATIDAAATAVRERAATQVAGRMPAIYLGHGAPPLLDDPLWVAELAAWASTLPRPEAVLMVSAHWVQGPLPTLGATMAGVPLVYDFYGFPSRYYDVTYPAPPAPSLAARLDGLDGGAFSVAHDPGRGLDHGAYVPLVAMYPDADVPVLQLSLPTLEPHALLALGARLRALRDEGVLIVGSGFMTHGLPFLRDFALDAPPPEWSTEFDRWVAAALERRDRDALAAFRDVPAARFAHPTVEHYAPLLVVAGAADPDAPWTTPITGFWLGLSKRSVQFA